ncbi:MAG TPA: hypothetical protein VJU83_07345 [Burkholderiales bacterium]|nr:hypothetical protein [Burkholderiales bacterium]
MTAHIKVWQFNDCECVAAESLEAAIAWYVELTGVEVEDVAELTVDDKPFMWTGEEPGDGEHISLKQAIAAHEGTFPDILCCTDT